MFRTLYEDKIFKREARLLLKDLDPPPVVTANVSFWHPGGNEERILNEVYQWLKDLNLRFGLGLTIEREGNTIRAFKDNQEFAYFTYYESQGHVYKHQNFKKLLSYITEIIFESPKTLSNDEWMFYEALSERLSKRWFNLSVRNMLIKKWDNFVSPIVSRVKFRDKNEIKEFLDIIEFERLTAENLSKLLNFIDALNITNYKKSLFKIYYDFQKFPLEALVELAKVIERKNLKSEAVKYWFSTSRELGKYPEVYKIFIEFLRNIQKVDDLKVWWHVLAFNPADLEFIKEIFGPDWSRLIRLLWEMDGDKDLRNRVHTAVKTRDRDAMEDIYVELVGRRLASESRDKTNFEIISQFLREKIFFVRMFIAGTPFEFAIGVKSDNAVRELIRYANLVFDRFDIELDFLRDYRKIRDLYANLVDGFVDYYGMAMVIENPQSVILTDKFFWIAPLYDIEPETRAKIESIYERMINKSLVDFIKALEREGLRVEFYYSRERSLAFAKDYFRLLVRKIKGLRTKAPKVAIVKLILDKTKREFLNERAGIS